MNFSEEWDKLKNLEVGKIITSFRWDDYPQERGDHIPVNLKGVEKARAIVIGVERIMIANIPLLLIQIDTKSTYKYEDFLNLMEHFYFKKLDWNSSLSIVKLYFLLITEVKKNAS